MALAKNIKVMWFRQDLRLADNPALTNALEDGKTLPIFILDDFNSKEHVNGAASKWWLHHSLIKLNKSLKNKLCFFIGNPMDILDEIRKQYVITARAKGLSEKGVLYGHVFRNAMLIVIAGFPAVFVSVFLEAH